MLIRPRTDDDLGSCVAALEHVYKFDGYPSSWPSDPRSWLTPQGLLRAWIARMGSSVVGHIAVGDIV